MKPDSAYIDPYLFERQFEAFKEFVEEKSGMPLISFASHPYIEKEEGYKYDIYRAARDALSFQAWEKSSIGSGKIVQSVITAIELPHNNLVPWQARFGEESRPHHPLFELQNQPGRMREVEGYFFALYREDSDDEIFTLLVENVFGKQYSLMAYLFFLKDRSRYLPISPTNFDLAFQHLGADFTTTRRCSWHNYSTYLHLVGEIKALLAEQLAGEVSLLDAHSFAWMLVSQMEKEHKLANVEDYLSLSDTEREAVIKARIGQGRFRNGLIQYWSACAVTGMTNVSLLRASHIKPWSKSTIEERLDPYNGLLLSPALDACFDAGYITFDDDGKIVISQQLSPSDATLLGLHPEMQLRRLEPEHKPYLKFHRESIFAQNS